MADALDGLTAALADRYRIDVGPDGQPPLLGQGGMATVYLAHDLKHHRKVAVKLIRPNVAAAVGAERFLHEIQVTANLQHPHILGLIDSGVVRVSTAGEGAVTLPYYVMPYVEGESLRQKLSREIQLPVEEALTITKAVASALDYAHRHGVIHRDIKPENILLHEGQALVADFGIALALTAAGGARLTETGVALGTPQYMSPEQGVGDREVGPRSDIFALGCVVYEMLAGEPPFTGPTAQAIIAKTIRDTPQPLRVGRPSVPVSVDLAVGKALEKLPADRFGTAGEFVKALEAGTNVVTPTAGPEPAVARASMIGRGVAVAAAFLSVGIGVGMWLRPRLVPAPPRPVMRFGLEMNPSVNSVAIGNRLALSPDGTTLVYVGGEGPEVRLYAQAFDRARASSFESDDVRESKPVPGTAGAAIPFFSPDGQWIGFVANGGLQKVPLAGGEPTRIALAEQISGASWGPDNTIVFASKGDLWRVPASGGEPAVLARPAQGEHALADPSVLPDGKAVAFARLAG